MMMPYLFTILVLLVISVKKGKGILIDAPGALGVPYSRRRGPEAIMGVSHPFCRTLERSAMGSMYWYWGSESQGKRIHVSWLTSVM